jgi:hypothetical protein
MHRMRRNYKVALRAISGVLGNISAGWFGVAMITPNFVDIRTFEAQITLTKDLLFGILFLVATIIIENFIKDE